jgi:hypothetical protein
MCEAPPSVAQAFGSPRRTAAPGQGRPPAGACTSTPAAGARSPARAGPLCLNPSKDPDRRRGAADPPRRAHTRDPDQRVPGWKGHCGRRAASAGSVPPSRCSRAGGWPRPRWREELCGESSHREGWPSRSPLSMIRLATGERPARPARVQLTSPGHPYGGAQSSAFRADDCECGRQPRTHPPPAGRFETATPDPSAPVPPSSSAPVWTDHARARDPRVLSASPGAMASRPPDPRRCRCRCGPSARGASAGAWPWPASPRARFGRAAGSRRR